ncbi:DUF1573 domain-containing protein [Wenyingzhuangia sp. chi5]|uniref:DUF1573 domain-containing protein n=1 Tax=Wenyingzhuangia gilva TaxID=3057677 RepID=A0ABT8VRX1_9FLAO|nr:DUF1573 domain-containing protein [Wenyingzhuangia sp. chi5]MDO3694714.1 DUF1573 domain-containing protein [Wenyingzhuangia sp. chi5]
MNRYLIYILFFSLVACIGDLSRDKAVDYLEQTSMRIEDPERHYFPIIRGAILKTAFKFYNTGDHPLVLKDVNTSCGCTNVQYSPGLISPGSYGEIYIEYNSGKNIGHVEFYIDVYANLDTVFKKTIKFDINVVTGADYTRDYEEVYNEFLKGQNAEYKKKGYYTELDGQVKY